MSIALLLLPLALAVPEYRAVEVGARVEFRFERPDGPVVPWNLEPSDPLIVAPRGAIAGRRFAAFTVEARSPGMTTLVFKRGNAVEHVVVLIVSPGKAGGQ